MQHFNYPPGMGRDYSAPSPVADNPPFPAPPAQGTWQTRLNAQSGPNQNAPGYAAPVQLPQQPVAAPGYGAPAQAFSDPAPGYGAPAQASYGVQPQPQMTAWRDLMQRWQQMNQPPPPRRLFAPRQQQPYGGRLPPQQEQKLPQPQNLYGTPDNRGLPVASRANLGSNHMNTWQQRLAGGQAGGPGKQPMIPQSRY